MRSNGKGAVSFIDFSGIPGKEYFGNGDTRKALEFCEEIMNCGVEMPLHIFEEIEEIYTQAKKKEKIKMRKKLIVEQKKHKRN